MRRWTSCAGQSNARDGRPGVGLRELFGCSDDPHDLARLARRQRVQLLDHQTWVLTAEDVVITKLRWGRHPNRSKDLDDARNVLAVRQGDLDLAYIRRWCTDHGTTADLDRLLPD